MKFIQYIGRSVATRQANLTAKFNAMPKARRTALVWGMALTAALVISFANPDPAYAQNLESFASKVRGLLSSTLLRTLAVIAVIVTGLLWFTGRASWISAIMFSRQCSRRSTLRWRASSGNMRL